jgi:hypothetical protein
VSPFRARAATVLAAALLVAGCTSDPGPRAGSRSPSGQEPSDSRRAVSSPTPTEPTTPPPDPACYRLTFEELPQITSTEDPVDCSARHTTQTIHVGQLDTVVHGHAVSVHSDHVRDQLAKVCPRRLARFLGGTAEERRLSRFEVVWFSPTLPQSDSGAAWFRCDVVALAGNEELFRLDRPGRMRGVLDREEALATYGLCGSAAPGTPDFARVICARPHRWRAISTIPLEGGREYPGVEEVRSAGDQVCSDQARALAEDPLQFRYGWEWPTREQWDRGQRYGYCWMPD